MVGIALVDITGEAVEATDNILDGKLAGTAGGRADDEVDGNGGGRVDDNVDGNKGGRVVESVAAT